MKKKIYMLAAIGAATVLSTQAQISKAKSSLTTVTSDLSGLFDTAVKVMYACAAIAGLIGAITLYQKWNSGDPNTSKLVGAWFGAALFLAISATFLKTMFL
ncbi:MAG: DUF4134 family protein [Bacteroidales bacterium]